MGDMLVVLRHLKDFHIHGEVDIFPLLVWEGSGVENTSRKIKFRSLQRTYLN